MAWSLPGLQPHWGGQNSKDVPQQEPHCLESQPNTNLSTAVKGFLRCKPQVSRHQDLATIQVDLTCKVRAPRHEGPCCQRDVTTWPVTRPMARNFERPLRGSCPQQISRKQISILQPQGIEFCQQPEWPWKQLLPQRLS